jgi:Icc-related predicted phosphoesterase
MLKFTCAADIHGDSNCLTHIGNQAITDGADAILIAGDICANRRYQEFYKMLYTLSEHALVPVIITPGNHDFWQAESFLDTHFGHRQTSVICLVDRLINFHGCFIYGTPWTIEYGTWNYMKKENDMPDMFPYETDILLCHSPPFGCGDDIDCGKNIGSKRILDGIKSSPNISTVLFGHCHDRNGWHGRRKKDNGQWVQMHNVSCYTNKNTCDPKGITTITFEKGKQ